MLPRHLRHHWLPFALLACIATGGILFVVPPVHTRPASASVTGQAFPPAGTGDITASSAHPPISIYNNSQLVAFPNKSGNGTSGDPYVIQDLHVSVSSGNAIELAHVDLHLLMVNITVVSTSMFDYGIVLYNCTNVAVTNCTATGFNRGFFISVSKDLQVSGNTASAGTYGYFLSYLQGCNVTGNHARDNVQDGFLMTFTTTSNLSGNVASANSRHGFSIGDNCTASTNTAENNSGSGFYLGYSKNAVVARNHIVGNTRGLLFKQASNNAVVENVFKDNDENMFVDTSSNNVIMGNGFYFPRTALLMVESDGTSMNAWDNGTTGNFWANYIFQKPGASNDGRVWDQPISILFDPLGWDRYPLVLAPGTTNQQPVADFTTNATIIATGTSVAFTFTGQGGNEPTFFTWIPGDGTANMTTRDPVHRYDTPGTYTVRLLVTDADGETSSIEETGCIVVMDNVAPVISHPDDITLIAASTGNVITWEVIDATVATTAYVVHLDGNHLVSGTWTSGTPFNVPIDGLAVGTHVVTIEVSDGLGGSTEDTVIVTVTAGGASIDSASPIFLVASITTGLAIVAARKPRHAA